MKTKRKSLRMSIGILSIVLIVGLFISGCSQQESEKVQQSEFEIKLNHIASIEEFPELDPPWIVRPAAVISHDDGFVLLDSQQRRIHVLHKDGTLKAAFGREGRGPGELLGAHFAFSIENEISIPDVNNARTSTFNDSGNFLRHAMHESQHPTISGSVHRWKENRYLTASYALNNSDCIFYELNAQSQITGECFGSYDALEHSDIELLKHIGRNGTVGELHFIDQDKFIFVPGFYYGVHYVFEWKENEWVQEKIIRGFAHNPVAAIEKNEYKQESGYFSIQYSGTEPMIAQILSRSYGYFPIDDYLLHITRQIVEDDEITIIELFTKDGIYLGHKAEDFPVSQQGKFGMSMNENHLAIVTSLDLDIYEVELIVGE